MTNRLDRAQAARIALITGTRRPLTNFDRVMIRGAVHWATFVLVGDCPTGVDAYVREYCDEGPSPNYRLFAADWSGEGKKAGPVRNSLMVADALTYQAAGARVRCYAFPAAGSRGTWDCLRKAINGGIETIVRRVDD